MIDVIADRIVRKNPFLRDWSNYGIIDIFNPVATAQYQHSVTIASKPGMMHDFRDLRFFQPDGTEIPFWIESKTDGSTAFVWFKPYSTSLKNVYVFYGNRDAVSQSNGDKVFEFFDDFLGSALDTAKWARSIGTGSYSVSGSIWTISNATEVWVSVLFSGYNIFHARAKVSSENFGFYIQLGSSGGAEAISFKGDSGKSYTTTHNSTSTNISRTTDLSTDYVLLHTIYRQNAVDFFENGTLKATSTTNIPTGDLGFRFVTVGTGSVLIDYVFVRKYTATEPTCQLNQSGLRNPAYR